MSNSIPSTPNIASGLAIANWDFFQSFLIKDPTSGLMIVNPDPTLCGSMYAFCYDGKMGKCPSGSDSAGNLSIFEMWRSAYKEVLGEYSSYIISSCCPLGSQTCDSSLVNQCVTNGVIGQPEATFYLNAWNFYNNLVAFDPIVSAALTSNDPTWNIIQLPLGAGLFITCFDAGTKLGLVTQLNNYIIKNNYVIPTTVPLP